MNGWYGVVLWICAELSVGMKDIFISRAYTDPRPFMLHLLPCWREGWRYMKMWDGPQPRKVVPTDQRVIPYHIASYSAYKVWGIKRKKRVFDTTVFVFSNNHYM